MSKATFIQRTVRALAMVLVASVAAVAVAACGSSGAGPSGSSTSARKLLEQTFKGKHSIKSGDLHLALTIVPKGSTELTDPITLALGGPFQSEGKLPDSDFTLALDLQGQKLSLGLISVGGHGYITDSGQAYKLPQSNYKKLESGLSPISGTGSSSKSEISKLNIEPLSWLSDPTLAGDQKLGGVATTRVHATVDVRAMVADVFKVLKNAGSLGVSGTSAFDKSLTAANAGSVARALGRPSFNLWTANNDHSLRKLTVNGRFPVSGKTSAALGGLRSASVHVLFAYTHLNQQQTISAPGSVKPYSDFQTQVDELIALLESAESSGSSSSGASSSTDGKYTACLAKADGDVAKMQRCQSLLK